MKHRRILRIVLIAFALLAFTGYFAFSTFLFSPLEKNYAYDVSTLAPRDVDFFIAKADLAADFKSDLSPVVLDRLAQTEAGQRLLDSPEWGSFIESSGMGGLGGQIGAELEKLPLSIDPLKVFGGRDVAIAGYQDGSGLSQARWAVYGRVNWMGKMAVELLDYPGLIGLEAQGLQASKENGAVTLSGGQLTSPLTIARVRDVLVLANDPSLVTSAREFEGKAGQDSLGQSARYHDEIQVRDREGDEVELLLRYATLAPRLGWPMASPDATSREWVEGFLGKLFQAQLVRDIAGTARLDTLTSINVSGALVSEEMSAFQKRFYRRKDATQMEVANRIARLAPADVGLFAYMEGDLGDLLRQLFDSLEPALVKNFESEIVAPVWGHSQVGGLISELEAALSDSVALVVKENSYTRDTDGAPVDGRVVPAWALVFESDDIDRVIALRDKVTQNTARLGLRGKPKGGGTYDAGVYKFPNAAGLTIFEYWSPVIPGTGHLASVDSPDFFILSNNWKMLDEMTKGYYGNAKTTLADRGDFVATVANALSNATLMVWLNPLAIAPALRQILAQQVEDDALNNVDWGLERERIGRELLADQHPGERWGSLAPDLETEVQDLIDVRIQDRREELRSELVPARLAESNRRVNLFAGIRGALIQLRLEPKTFELALRILGDNTP